MVVSDFVPKVYLKATGKVATFTTGSTKWLKILALANIQIDNWIDEPNVDWKSLYNADFNFGTVTAAQQFQVPLTMRKVSQQETDVVRIVHTDGVTFTDYDIIDNDREKDYANGMRTSQIRYVTLIGNNAIRFNRAFASTDPQFGGTLYCSGYNYVPVSAGAAVGSTGQYLVLDTDVIPVDIPNWLVYAVAADYNSTDVTRQNLVPRLEAAANEIMNQMKSNNKGQVSRLLQPWRPLGENWSNSAFTG